MDLEGTHRTGWKVVARSAVSARKDDVMMCRISLLLVAGLWALSGGCASLTGSDPVDGGTNSHDDSGNDETQDDAGGPDGGDPDDIDSTSGQRDADPDEDQEVVEIWVCDGSLPDTCPRGYHCECPPDTLSNCNCVEGVAETWEPDIPCDREAPSCAEDEHCICSATEEECGCVPWNCNLMGSNDCPPGLECDFYDSGHTACFGEIDQCMMTEEGTCPFGTFCRNFYGIFQCISWGGQCTPTELYYCLSQETCGCRDDGICECVGAECDPEDPAACIDGQECRCDGSFGCQCGNASCETSDSTSCPDGHDCECDEFMDCRCHCDPLDSESCPAGHQCECRENSGFNFGCQCQLES